MLDFIPSVTAGESYWLTDTQQRPINYPNKDVTVPPCNTEGWAVHTQKMASEIYFCLDLNCEGGFNFRPDDTKLKGIKQR